MVEGFSGSPAVSEPNDRVAAPTAEAVVGYIQREQLQAPVIIRSFSGWRGTFKLGARHPSLVGRLMIIDVLPFYTLMFDPAATSETARPRAAAFRASLLAASGPQAEASQTAAIARLAKTETVDLLCSKPSSVRIATRWPMQPMSS